MTVCSRRPPLRLITIAWGKWYIDTMLTLTLPAVLAEGNLPALLEYFDCEFIWVTEERHFAYIRQSAVMQRLQALCPAVLIPIDDLLYPKYGMTLTFAYVRGFADLGPRMLDTYLLFLNADFVLADGSYRNLAKRILAGEVLIFAPSYCVVAEQVAPCLRDRVNVRTGTLAIPPREMAGLAIPNRHNTIRAKTVNERHFRMHRHEQFFWCVDEQVLLAHQLPIAVICMKPQKVVTELATYWDYGLIAELAPAAPRCVLGDSDEFLMIELRAADALKEHMMPGWPSAAEIAKDLSTFTTADQRELGRYGLVLHAREIDGNALSAKAALQGFVDDVYRALAPEPVGHLDHPFWRQCIDEFQRWRDEFARHNGIQSIFGKIAHSLLGDFPTVTRNHPYWADLRHANMALDETLTRPGVHSLIVSSGTALLSRRVESGSATYYNVGAAAGSVLYASIWQEPGSFDLCLCEIAPTELGGFQALYAAMRQMMKPGGRIIVLALNNALAPWPDADSIVRQALAHGDRVTTSYAGSPASALAKKVFHRCSQFRLRGGIGGSLAFLAMMSGVALPTYLANRRAEHRPATLIPQPCTSVTFDIRVA